MKQETKRRQRIIKIITVISALAVILMILYFIFNLMGGQSKLLSDFQAWANENIVVASIVYLVASPIINIIPGISSMFFITIANMMYNDQTLLGMMKAFLLSATSVTLTSSLMFLIGRYGGKKLVHWILGDDELIKGKKLINLGGKACLPFVYLLPLFPDDTISMIAGMTDMSFWYNFVCSVLFRSAGSFVICFLGADFLDYKSLTIPQWLGLILLALVAFAICFFLARAYYKYLEKKSKEKFNRLTEGLLPPQK